MINKIQLIKYLKTKEGAIFNNWTTIICVKHFHCLLSRNVCVDKHLATCLVDWKKTIVTGRVRIDVSANQNRPVMPAYLHICIDYSFLARTHWSRISLSLSISLIERIYSLVFSLSHPQCRGKVISDSFLNRMYAMTSRLFVAFIDLVYVYLCLFPKSNLCTDVFISVGIIDGE